MNKGTSKTCLGLPENLEALLCYSLGWLSGMALLLMEKKSFFVKFHAMQSIFAFLPLFVLKHAARLIPFYDKALVLVLNIFMVFLWAVLVYRAYNNELYRLPVVGRLVRYLSGPNGNKE